MTERMTIANTEMTMLFREYQRWFLLESIEVVEKEDWWADYCNRDRFAEDLQMGVHTMTMPGLLQRLASYWCFVGYQKLG